MPSYASLPSSYCNFGAWLGFSGEDETEKNQFRVFVYFFGHPILWGQRSRDFSGSFLWHLASVLWDWHLAVRSQLLKPFLWVVIYGTRTLIHSRTLRANGVLLIERLKKCFTHDTHDSSTGLTVRKWRLEQCLKKYFFYFFYQYVVLVRYILACAVKFNKGHTLVCYIIIFSSIAAALIGFWATRRLYVWVESLRLPTVGACVPKPQAGSSFAQGS